MLKIKVGDKRKLLFLERKDNDYFLLAINGFPIIKIGYNSVVWKIDNSLQELIAVVKKRGYVETKHRQKIGPKEIEIRGPEQKISDALAGIDVIYSSPHRCKEFNELSNITRKILVDNLKKIMGGKGKLTLVWESILETIENGSLDISLDNIIDQAAGLGVEVKDLFDSNYRFQYKLPVGRHS